MAATPQPQPKDLLKVDQTLDTPRISPRRSSFVEDGETEGAVTQLENQTQPLYKVRIGWVKDDEHPGSYIPQAQGIGMWEFDDILGQGAFGLVYAAHHIEKGTKAAIKRADKPTAPPPLERGAQIGAKEMQEREDLQNYADFAARESVLLKALDHPHIVGVHEILETKHDRYIVMELAESGTLAEYLGKTNLTQTARLFGQIVDAISHCHSLKVCHRDLKLDNILLDENSNIKIADFGLGYMQADGTRTIERCGTPYYMAPEIIHKQPYDGRASDIWSLGVIFYTMIVGDLPFTGTTREVEVSSTEGQYSVPSWVPGDARDLIERMLSVIPEERITMWEIVHHPFFERSPKRPQDPIPTLEDLTFGSISDPKTIDQKAFQSLLCICPCSSPESLTQALLSKSPNVEQMVYHRIFKFNQSRALKPKSASVVSSSHSAIYAQANKSRQALDVFGVVDPVPAPKPKRCPRVPVPPRPKVPTYQEPKTLPHFSEVKAEVFQVAPVQTPASLFLRPSVSDVGTPILLGAAGVSVPTRIGTTRDVSSPLRVVAVTLLPTLESAPSPITAKSQCATEPCLTFGEIGEEIMVESVTPPLVEDSQIPGVSATSKDSSTETNPSTSAPSSARWFTSPSSLTATGSMPSLITPASSIGSLSSPHMLMTPSALPPLSFICLPPPSEVNTKIGMIQENSMEEVYEIDLKPEPGLSPSRLRYLDARRAVPSSGLKDDLMTRLFDEAVIPPETPTSFPTSVEDEGRPILISLDTTEASLTKSMGDSHCRHSSSAKTGSTTQSKHDLPSRGAWLKIFGGRRRKLSKDKGDRTPVDGDRDPEAFRPGVFSRLLRKSIKAVRLRKGRASEPLFTMVNLEQLTHA